MWKFVSLAIAVTALATALAQEVTVTAVDVSTPLPPTSCVNVLEDECPPWRPLGGHPSKPRCKTVGHDALVCCHLRSMFDLKEQVAGVNMPVIRYLSVRNATLPELDASFFITYYSLESLAITGGNVTKITGQFPPNIVCLNLSGNALADIEDNALGSLGRLNMLDISRNNLTRLPAINVGAAGDFWLDISGTNELPCSGIQQIMSKMGNDSRRLYFLHKSDTFCNLVVAYWFNNTEKVPLAQIEQRSKILEACPYGATFKCTCKIHRVDIPMGSSVTYSVAVDCSGQQLTALPDHLPLETVALNVSNNNISNLVQLSGTVGSGYSKIREFDGDNNRISSISVLEGSDFINKFARLSLRYNNLSVIPTYFLSSRFDRNDVNNGYVSLGGNKIECNCDTVPLKAWLQSNKRHVQDYDEVQCKNMEISVVELDRSKVCMYKHVWTDYIYYIIAGEVALLLMLVGKVSYDYWVFKTAGYLPWPASKMPKLPCDWVFES